MSDETEGISNARETLDLVLAAALRLVQRAIEHVDTHDVEFVQIADTLAGGGFMWRLEATYGKAHSFATAHGRPQPTGGPVFTSVEELAAVMQNEQAAFTVDVLRMWVELAVRGQEADEASLVAPARHAPA